jgi:hypothetical protein
LLLTPGFSLQTNSCLLLPEGPLFRSPVCEKA